MRTQLQSGFVNHLLLFTLLGLGVSGGVGVGAVWMQHRISEVANGNKALEAQIDNVERESEQLTADIAGAQDPAELLRLNARWKLGFAAPAEDHIYPMTVDAERRLAQKRSGEGLVAPAGETAIGFALAR